MNHEYYMNLALNLAKQGNGHVNPNPLVGAVIVKDGKIIGSGYHEQFGGLHAERNAFYSCKESANGATLYVTLEPCCHYGKQPPCTEAILEHGIKNVIIGSLDPNPLVSGKGIQMLESHGVEVITGVLKEECDQLNQVFFHFIKNKTPYVVMKYAMTIDGKIATSAGKSKWITGEQARNQVQYDRNRLSAIMTGVGTVLADNPRLTCRMKGGRNPVRIICDTHLRTPLDAIVVSTANEVRTILATSVVEEERQRPYLQCGCEVVTVTQSEGHLNLQELMKVLGNLGIDSILLEGGATLNAAALKSRIVHRVQAYVAPKLFGGESAKTPVGGNGIQEVADCVKLKNLKVCTFGEDYLIEGEVDEACLQE